MLNKKTIRSSFLLLLTAFIWGIAFVAQSVGMEHVGVFSFCMARYFLGAVVLLPLVIIRRRSNKKKRIPSAGGRITWMAGICCGLALAAASIFQQMGIQYTTVGKAGFITTLYIILVPILGIFLKKRIPAKVWLCAVLAAIGMYLLCMSERLQIANGDLLVFVCAVLFSIHILVIDYFSPLADGVEISCVQFFTAGAVSFVLMLIFEHPQITDFTAAWMPIAYAGILSSGVGYTLQVVGQKDMEPTAASLILSLESMFSVLAGWILLDQSLTKKELVGCALMFLAVILVQLPEKKHNSA